MATKRHRVGNKNPPTDNKGSKRHVGHISRATSMTLPLVSHLPEGQSERRSERQGENGRTAKEISTMSGRRGSINQATIEKNGYTRRKETNTPSGNLAILPRFCPKKASIARAGTRQPKIQPCVCHDQACSSFQVYRRLTKILLIDKHPSLPQCPCSNAESWWSMLKIVIVNFNLFPWDNRMKPGRQI
jgi:hypothetical protein